MKKIIPIFLLVLFFRNVIGQTSRTNNNPSKEVIARAKLATQNRMILLRDSLSLNSNETKIRDFTLTRCNETQIKSKYKSLTPAGDFNIKEGCPGLYSFFHQTNKKGSHYGLMFFFNSLGNLVYTNIEWSMVVH